MRLNFSVMVAILSIVVCVLLTPSRFEEFDGSLQIIFTCICLLNTIIYFRTVKHFYSSWLRYDVLFIIGFLILHFQIPFLETIGISPERPSYIWINKRVVNFASWFSVLVFLLWMLGFYLFLIKKKGKYVIRNKEYSIKKSPFFDILLVVSFAAFLMLVGGEFYAGNHAGSYNWGSGATYAYVVLRVTLSLSIIYFFINNRIKLNTLKGLVLSIFNNKLLFIISILYCLMFLFVGDRGPVMELAILFFVGYSLFQKKISLTHLLVMLFIGATVFTIIRYGRSRDVTFREGNVISSGYQNLQKQDNPFNLTDELASSVRILYTAMNAVPYQHPYLYGTTLVSNVVDVIPFSVRFYKVPEMYNNSTTFFTYLGQGQFYTYGEGSEIIADLYINLGFWLTLLVFFWFGYGISYLTFDAHYIRNHTVLVIYILLAATAIYINRSNFLYPLKIIVYALVIDWLFTRKLTIDK